MLRDQSIPRFSVLLATVSFLCLIPLGIFGTTRLHDANQRVDAALEVQESATRLDLLLRLSPAISNEQLSTIWSSGDTGLLGDLPPAAALLLGSDLADGLEPNRAIVDAIEDQLKDPAITASLAAVRRDAASGSVDLFDFDDRYADVLDLVELELGRELARLNRAATAAGAGEIVQATRVAEAAAGVQVVASGQETRWAQLSVGPILPPVREDVTTFSDSVSVFDERAAHLERVAGTWTTVGSEWAEVRYSRAGVDLLEDYRRVVDEYAVSGLSASTERQTTLDLAGIGTLQILVFASEVQEGLALAKEFQAGIAGVVDTSLMEVEAAAVAAVSDARTDRVATMAWLMLFTVLISGSSLAMVMTVGRPVKRMALAAHRLSMGQLDVELPETGPTEVRTAAKALNEAIESVRLAEKQAVALAEERLGADVLKRSAPGELGKSLQAAVDRLATSLAERDNFQRQLAHEAAHDHLTKLSNRNAILRHLTSALARAQRTSSSIALLFLDIDDFKSINDLHGHHTGDVVLRAVAERLLSSIREGDLAGRLGGDEFVVVAEPVADIDAAIILSNRVIAAVNEPITVEGVTFFPSVSIGVGIADGTSSLTADELLRDADSAVYRAKNHGKGRVEVCDEELRSVIKERDALEQAIQIALDNDEFELRYQPIVHAADQGIVSVEALIRWQRPGIGLIGPDTFIPVAERSDLILSIDRWVLCAAAGQLAAWSSDSTLADVAVAVNVSSRHLGCGTLCADVQAAVDRHGINASNLMLEVTETALLSDMETAARELSELRMMGVRIALDDFGTGFMSLTHLRDLPVDILKVDRSFVAKLDSHENQSLVQLIVDTGHLLGVSVTGEGVETAGQARTLAMMDVDHLQGFYFGGPVPPDELVTRAAELQRSASAHSVSTSSLLH